MEDDRKRDQMGEDLLVDAVKCWGNTAHKLTLQQ